MNRSLLGMVVLTSLWAGPLRAQTAAPILASTEPPVDEIERGVFFGVDIGPAFLTGAPAPSGGNSPFSSGATLRLEVGYDIGRFVSLSVFFAGTSYSANADYVGYSGGNASGDFSDIAAGLAVRWNFLGFADSQGVQRTWLYLKGAAGFALLKPNALFSSDPTNSYGSILVFGGPGLQYYTRLRHFSVGVEIVGSYLLKPKSFGFAITPNLRYAF
ncbi:MAG TPA: adventurous gliding motility protein CglE [Myxococcaceae bacterium]|nr:adventurous gliding motility protein CglE [Myxococcaceae bacterium]